MKGFTTNKTKLAKECGFKSRQGLYEFMEKPGWPQEVPGKGFNIADCRAFVLANTEKEAIAANLDSDIADLKKWDIYERARKTKIANDHKDRLLIPKAEKENEIQEMAAECQKILYTIPPRSPELAGHTVTEIEKRLTTMIDEAVAAIAKG